MSIKKKAEMGLLLKKLVLLILLQVTFSQGSLWPYGKVHVRVNNRLGQGSLLTIHCQSKDDDLGVHVLPNDDFVQWSFKPHIIEENTLFFCKLQWQNKTMSFDAYKEGRDLYGCHKTCYWDVLIKTGACMLKSSKPTYDFCFNWPEKKIVEVEHGYTKILP